MKIDREQTLLLNKLKLEYTLYTQDADTIEVDALIAKEIRKQPVKNLIQQARNAGIPLRQIHLNGMGFASVASLEKFLAPISTGSRAADLVDRIDPTKTVETIKADAPIVDRIIEVGSGDYDLRDEQGTTHRFHYWDFGGVHIVNFKGRENNQNVTDSMKRQIFDRWPDVQLGFDVRLDKEGRSYIDRGEEI